MRGETSVSDNKKLFRKVLWGCFAVVALFLIIWGSKNDGKLYPLLNAAQKASGVMPSCTQYPAYSKNAAGYKEVLIQYYTNTDDDRDYENTTEPRVTKEGRRALELQLKGMSDYLESNPDFFLRRDEYLIFISADYHGSLLRFSNTAYLDMPSMPTSRRIEHTFVDHGALNYYGSDFLREMHTLLYDAVGEGEKGGFLEEIGDPSVLENLERIGPKSNFSDEELAWFAENLPDCEIVDTDFYALNEALHEAGRV